jgi:hypothetical protein
MRRVLGHHNSPVRLSNGSSENTRQRLGVSMVNDRATGAAQRSTNPSIGELRLVTQPDSVRTRAGAEHWVASAYLRAVSPYLTKVLLRAGLSANGVTWLMILSAGLAAVVTGWPGLLSAFLLVVLTSRPSPTTG